MKRSGTQSIERAILLLKELSSRGSFGWRLSDLAQRCQMDVGTTHRILACLGKERLVHRRPSDRHYLPGPMLFELGLSQTALLGFSQGCVMTLDAGFRYPHRLAALVGISGYVWQPDELLRELSPVATSQRALFTHGTRDPLIPLLPVREQVAQLRAAALDLTWREFDKVHTVAGEPELALIRGFLGQAFGR